MLIRTISGGRTPAAGAPGLKLGNLMRNTNASDLLEHGVLLVEDLLAGLG
jgi:hypothetical protein